MKWIVSITSEHDDPLIAGPYSEKKAKEIVEKFNATIDSLTDEDRLGNFLYAGCYPISPKTITELRREFDLPKRVIASS